MGSLLTRGALVAGLTFAGGISHAGAQSPPDTGAVKLTFGVKVPMPDGIHLNATIYQPKGQREPLPVVLWLTPYIADMSHARAMYFARHGYVFALVDTRGRGNSEGRFEPFVNEAQDGHDLVEWLARQPFSNGKVTFWGGSYGGFFQWAIAKDPPPHLVSMLPVASGYPGVDFPQLRNIFQSYAIQWATFTSGVTPQTNLFGDPTFWVEKYQEMYLGHLPFASLDTIAGNLTTIYPTWMQHPIADGYWDRMTPTPEEYAKIDLPILTVTGYFDADQIGALTYYRRHQRYATAHARAQHYLIVGPWDHPGTRTPVADLGGLHFGAASVLDMNALNLAWYDWTTKQGPKPAFLKKRVAYWVIGANEWKYADDVESISDSTLRLHLDSRDGANDVLHSGLLTTAPVKTVSPPDRYLYDPLDTRPAALEMQPQPAAYLEEQTSAFNLMGNGLIYHSAPFPKAVEITGTPKLTVWLSLDVPDTDFEVALYEVRPDGSAIYLADDALRARYRDSPREAHLVTPGEITRFVFDQFTFFSRQIQEGSRLRLILRSPNSMAWEKNYNSGHAVALESGADARTAHVTLYHDPTHASVLELPVVSAERNRLVP